MFSYNILVDIRTPSVFTKEVYKRFITYLPEGAANHPALDIFHLRVRFRLVRDNRVEIAVCDVRTDDTRKPGRLKENKDESSVWVTVPGVPGVRVRCRRVSGVRVNGGSRQH